MDDLLSEFLTETSESLAVLDVELVKFEQDPSDTEILGNIFRLVHTIKGTCGFLGLPRLESVAHAGENVLGKFRDGVIDVSPEAVTMILKCLDCIRELLGELEETGEEPEGEDKELIAELNAMAEGESASAPAEEAPAAAVGKPRGKEILPYFLRRGLQRPGAIFVGHDSQGSGCQAGWREDRYRRHRHFHGNSGKGQGRPVFPIRSAARPAYSAAGQIFRAKG